MGIDVRAAHARELHAVPTSPDSARATFGGSGGILLLGNYRPTISLVRTLKPLGYRLIVGLGGGEGGAQYSRFVDEVWDHPPLDGGSEAFLAALNSLLVDRPDITVVLPVAEEFVRVVSMSRQRLPGDRTYAVPARGVIDATLDKVSLWRLAQSLGVPVAPYGVATSWPELERFCSEVGYPAVLRPFESTRRLRGKKALIVASPDDLSGLVGLWPTGHPAITVQRWVPGRRHNLYFAARDGRIVRIVEAVIDRTDEPDGTGLAVEGRTIALSPDLAGFTEVLATALEYTGVGCVQFLVDEKTRGVHLLELNPRIAGNHAIAEAAGLALGPVSITLADGNGADLPFVSGTTGLVYAWTYGDLRGLLSARLRGRLSRRDAALWAGRLVKTAASATVHMTWRWDDPMPTVMLYARHIPLLGRLVGFRDRRPTRFASPGALQASRT